MPSSSCAGRGFCCKTHGVLVPAPGEVDENKGTAGAANGKLASVRKGMRAFKGGDDPLTARERAICRSRRFVADGDVVHAAGVLQMGVFGTDARVVEPGGNRMRQADLALCVLQDEGASAVQHSHAPGCQTGRMLARRVEAAAGSLNTPQLYRLVAQEVRKDSERVASSADAGDDVIGQAPKTLETLRARLRADDAAELAYHERIRVRTHGRTDDVKRVGCACRPITKSLVGRILERPAAAL